ncbi:NHL domain-containing thioredoxin family protein [Kibdelosporangium phytohabitans]|uniref:Alkyl hydroperoxide reductase n=1 Tax=Kibdelosporangium phytohabitans TaxID=860235 RepID=A0A0N9ID55_9PSEU|nr:NHL domain-containing thioredoxin family protein [Kibdelosporangium phytohabitans]ALG14331.1 alkyl hydroperoxide reductase [Kibdelosporangium phytohabitans]MBE1466650.1 thiol-disulfide isomerase/thioredoxin [Kibdelosporangium phytohabitans]
MTSSTTRRARVRAPELVGRGWLNTGDKDLALADLRGKIVLLDFWTFCCINCLHVLDELRPLEEEYADVLVTIGVHSPKFVHEADAEALAAAVERYEVHHPVLDDPELTTWQNYAVKAWPTLVLIDPEGYVVHHAAGEGHAEALRRVIRELVGEHEEKGTLHRGDGPYSPPERVRTELRFPSKVVVTPQGTLLVADAANHSVAELEADGETLVRRFGTGQRGRSDGTAPSFSEPSGIALLPDEVAARTGYQAVVADTVNHLLRGLNLDTGEVTTIAGTGEQWRDGPTDGPAAEIDLSSPWDVVWWDGKIIIAMAGNHTLSAFDPITATVSRYAGTTVEGLSDGPKAEAFFAQTSGLAADGDRLWLVDSETSALRWIGTDHVVHTAIGKGLFDFGHRDGDADQALLQHPLGVTVLGDGSVAIADTYNGAIRRYDPGTGQVSTLADGIKEPSAAAVVDGKLVVVASAAHRLEWPVSPGDNEQLVAGKAHQVKRPPTVLAPGDVELTVVFQPPPGQKLDERYGPSTRLEITSSPPELLVDGAGTGTDLSRRLVLAEGVDMGVLHVVAQAASCDDDPAIEHPACRLTRQDWGVPVRVEQAGLRRLPLMLGGMDD